MPTRGGGFGAIYSEPFLEVTVARASSTESNAEQAALDWLEGLGWGIPHGPTSAPITLTSTRKHKSKKPL